MKNVLITGGAGFIGSNLAEYLLEKGHNITIIDDLSTGSRKNLSKIINDINFIEADIRDNAIIEDICKNIDGIVHLAAVSSVALSVEKPLYCNEVNIDATLNLLNTARDYDICKFVFASSSAVYGNPPGDILVSEKNKTFPLTPYAVSKLTGEMYCQVFTELYSLCAISLRLFNVYGARQNPRSEYSAVIPKFIDSIANNTSPTIYGDGYQTRDFIYIKDVISAIELALKMDRTGVYNIASGSSYSINELISILTTLFGKNVKPVYAPARYGEVKYSQADISLAKSQLRFNPLYSLEEGLRDTFLQLDIPVRL